MTVGRIIITYDDVEVGSTQINSFRWGRQDGRGIYEWLSLLGLLLVERGLPGDSVYLVYGAPPMMVIEMKIKMMMMRRRSSSSRGDRLSHGPRCLVQIDTRLSSV